MTEQTMFFLAATSAANSGRQTSSFPMLATLVLMVLIMYVFLIRPQSKKQKALREMLSNLKKGDRIITLGGIYGTIVTVKDSSLVLKVDKNTELEIVRENVSRVISTEEPVPQTVKNKPSKKAS